MNKKIKMNYIELLENISSVVKKAGEWTAGQGSGEVQLYARFNPETGHVVEYFIETFAGHNSWVEADDIICVWIEKWFHPLEHEDYSEWLENELYYDQELFKEFKKKYFDEYEEDIEDETDGARKYNEFRSLFPEKWEELEKKWEEEALGFIIEEIQNKYEFRRLLEEFDVSHEYPTTKK